MKIAEPKRLHPLFVIAMIELALEHDNPRDMEKLIRNSLQYGKCGTMKREEVEWVLNHSLKASIQKEWQKMAEQEQKQKKRVAKKVPK